MTFQQDHCPFCKRPAKRSMLATHHRFFFSKGCGCGEYYANEVELSMYEGELTAPEWMQIAALLLERRFKNLPKPIVLFGSDGEPEINSAPIVRVEELLATWPETVPERIDRCLCNLANCSRIPGEVIEIKSGKYGSHLLFTEDDNEARFYVESLGSKGWVERPAAVTFNVYVTVDGWSRVGELFGGLERKRNPAFVAMWFGGKERDEQERMTQRFEGTLRVACKSAGWQAERVDSVEHNDSIIDRVMSMIRVAPFVIADLITNNQGVYYEAGFARGQNVPVIYLVREGEKPHFDVTGVNHVRWSTEDELRKKLENRILGTMGRGPHKASLSRGEMT